MDLNDFLDEWRGDGEWVKVRTSGSTGMPKELLVEKNRMRTSARMTCDFFGLKAGDTALLCMSTDYIAGKMMIVRAIECDLRLLVVKPSGHPLSDISLSDEIRETTIDFAAMVPLQVWNSLQIPVERERLRRIKNLIIGGGAIHPALEQELRSFPGNIYSTYGMTETLSHIAMRKISGPDASFWYKTLPEITVFQTSDGCLGVDAPAICNEKLLTNDLVEMKNGAFRVVGRRDFVICSGGIKIIPEEIERVLSGKIPVPFAISKRKNQRFGEVVVMVSEGGVEDELREICKRELPEYWQPKEYVTLSQIPRTETDKIARKRLEQMIE